MVPHAPSDLATLQTARDVSDWVEHLFGIAKPPTGQVIHVTASYETEGEIGVLNIGEDSPKSTVDYFVLNWTRSIASGILITGKILRDEPTVRYNLDGPGAHPQALMRYRSEAAGLKDPPLLLILTSGRGLDGSHPAFRSWARPVLFTDEAGEKRSRQALPDERVQVVAVPEPSPRSALAYLKEQCAGKTLSIEAGPQVARALHQIPCEIDTLYLSRYLGTALSPEVRGSVLMSNAELTQRWREAHAPYRAEEPSGLWSFTRLVRRR